MYFAGIKAFFFTELVNQKELITMLPPQT